MTKFCGFCTEYRDDAATLLNTDCHFSPTGEHEWFDADGEDGIGSDGTELQSIWETLSEYDEASTNESLARQFGAHDLKEKFTTLGDARKKLYEAIRDLEQSQMREQIIIDGLKVRDQKRAELVQAGKVAFSKGEPADPPDIEDEKYWEYGYAWEFMSDFYRKARRIEIADYAISIMGKEYKLPKAVSELIEALRLDALQSHSRVVWLEEELHLWEAQAANE
jgi:hypothetical protein